MPVNFDLNDLYAFRALLEYGNFRLAAESICLSQSALSRRIEKLEAALGTKLFDRTTRRVTLTLYGQTFADRCGQLLVDVESMLSDIDKASEERTGLITVATVPSAACYFMPDVIRRFQSRYPACALNLSTCSAGNVIEAVTRGQADLVSALPGVYSPTSSLSRWWRTSTWPPADETARFCKKKKPDVAGFLSAGLYRSG